MRQERVAGFILVTNVALCIVVSVQILIRFAAQTKSKCFRPQTYVSIASIEQLPAHDSAAGIIAELG
jgi:hypothetical protein